MAIDARQKNMPDVTNNIATAHFEVILKRVEVFKKR